MADEKITIILVEDHPLFRQGLRQILEAEEDIEVIQEIADGSQAFDLIKELAPDVVIMDINLPGENGLQVTRKLKYFMSEIAIIVLTAYHNEMQIFHSIKAGAAAYFPKDVDSHRLVEAIRQVHKGIYVIDDEVLDEPEVAAWLLEQFEKIPYVDGYTSKEFTTLSPREMEILQHIAKGKSNKEVAYDLGISRQTVKNHMTSILRKLAVNDRTQAALLAVELGWIPLHKTKVE